jgi:hypothetical protein
MTTMLDDDQLASLFARAAEGFAVPETGAAEILDAARSGAGGPGTTTDADDDADDTEADGASGDGDRPGTSALPGAVRRLGAAANRHRVLAVAACVLVALLVAGTVGAFTQGSSPSPQLQANAPTGVTGRHLGVAGAPTTTTTPGFGDNHAPSAIAGGSSGAASSAAAPSKGAVAQPSPPVTTPTTAPNPSVPSSVGQPAKIEQTGTLGLTVARGKLNRTMTQLTFLAAANGGFVATSQTASGAGSGGAPYGSITLQVPVANFSAVVKQAQALGKTNALSTKATDVTGQYVDLQARIASLEASRQQYLTIMTKATTVGDVLSVQSQLDSIQTEIEQLQGQLQVLDSETSYSTLAVTVNEHMRVPPPGPLPESGVVRSWHDSINGFLDGVDGVIRLAGPVLFALVLLALLGLGGRALWRRYQRHNL